MEPEVLKDSEDKDATEDLLRIHCNERSRHPEGVKVVRPVRLGGEIKEQELISMHR
jgi:hypothetical protein